ncbi:head-tail connector protein [Halomonas sp. DP5N14-9]|uniref:head-tail connector protein n=1 Tax=Halomonas sp. DP5N14-9 TaxID=2859075 RepID=UPI001C99B53E|nr:head-tail connector protein [Halomonas sp. DP5N14-9]MBY5942774.1 head-tail connector protein [Halomonas sp. DP5N14-9]
MLDLPTIKLHCRLDPDYTEEDDLLEVYSQAASRFIENQTDRTLYASSDSVPDEDDCPLVMDGSVRTAMLLLIGHWYENREAVVVGTITSEVPMAVEALIQPYRIYGV